VILRDLVNRALDARLEDIGENCRAGARRVTSAVLLSINHCLADCLALKHQGQNDREGDGEILGSHLLRQQRVRCFWSHPASGELDDDLRGRHGMGRPERAPGEDEGENQRVEMHPECLDGKRETNERRSSLILSYKSGGG